MADADAATAQRAVLHDGAPLPSLPTALLSMTASWAKHRSHSDHRRWSMPSEYLILTDVPGLDYVTVTLTDVALVNQSSWVPL